MRVQDDEGIYEILSAINVKNLNRTFDVLQEGEVMAKRAEFEIEGMKELERTIRKLGKLTQKCVTPAKKGAGSP